MSLRWLHLVTIAIAALALPACAAEQSDDEPALQTEDGLNSNSAPFTLAELKKIPTPDGMPTPYAQPQATGLFKEGGKCGPTAVANTLRLYWISVTPEQADEDGVHSLVGTLASKIVSYMRREHPELGCTLEHPTDGAAFLRNQLSAGHPVMAWFNIDGINSHWATAVGTRGTGDAEVLILMSEGAYRSVPMTRFVGAWKNVYGFHNPSVVCSDSTALMQ